MSQDTSQTITPELRRWILDQVAAGHPPEAVLQAMSAAGWQEDVALAALETTLTRHLAEHGPASRDTGGPVEADGTSDSLAPAGNRTADDSPGHGQPLVAVAESEGAAVAAASASSAALAELSEGKPAAAAELPTSGLPSAAQRWAQRLSRPAAAAQPAKAVPGPDLSGSPRLVDVGDRQVRVVVSMAKPRVVVFADFLSPEECDGLVAAARPRMARSLTVENQTGGESVNPDRTSQGMFFRRAENELVARIETRIARLLQWPLENGEGVQVLHYQPGAEYKPHYDYFDPSQPGTPSILKRGGQRVGTLVMYLNNPERGGGTTFPDVGLEVLPQRGHAVFFSYDSPHPSTQTLHGGAPVLAGEKWVATKWLREAEFI
jgi:prolyl 4-hydroxylase